MCVGEGCGNDECEGNGMVCEKVMQTCVDPNPSPRRQVTGNAAARRCTGMGRGTRTWLSASLTSAPRRASRARLRRAGTDLQRPIAGHSGRLVVWLPVEFGGATQARGPAVWVQSECAVDGNIEECKQAGQRCVDPNETTVGDWGCQCDAPCAGFAKGGIAVCTLYSVDECTDIGFAASALFGKVGRAMLVPLYIRASQKKVHRAGARLAPLSADLRDAIQWWRTLLHSHAALFARHVAVIRTDTPVHLVLYTDACPDGLGAVLFRLRQGVLIGIESFSEALPPGARFAADPRAGNGGSARGR